MSKPKYEKPNILLLCYLKSFCAHSTTTLSNKTSIKETKYKKHKKILNCKE